MKKIRLIILTIIIMVGIFFSCNFNNTELNSSEIKLSKIRAIEAKVVSGDRFQTVYYDTLMLYDNVGGKLNFYSFSSQSLILSIDLPNMDNSRGNLIEVDWSGGNILYLHYLNYSRESNNLDIHTVDLFSIDTEKRVFSYTFSKGVVFEAGVYFSPILISGKYIFVRGTINPQWDNYFSNPLEMVLDTQTRELRNFFPIIERDYMKYGSYNRGFLSRCMVYDSLLVYSVPSSSQLRIYTLSGERKKNLELGDFREFNKKAAAADFNDVMMQIKTEPYYYKLFTFQNGMIGRVFLHKHEEKIKRNENDYRNWTLYFSSIDGGNQGKVCKLPQN